METPDDPGEPEPSEKEIRRSFRIWLIWTGLLAVFALVVISYGEATGGVHFFF